METKPASQTKARVIILAVFVLGLAAGALSTNLYQRLTNSGPARADRPHGKPTDVLDKLNNRLNLSPDQQASIREILQGTFNQYDGIKKDIEPRMDVVRQQGRQRIREVLKPDQLPKYEEMVREHDAEREKSKNEGK
ncbi:MAG TPA: hypothetical protein VN345_09960 [Blastocatellia bacterium]|jgi:hypothetical protein|nr:hypothetical protein [Blastocatellia bacterium]